MKRPSRHLFGDAVFRCHYFFVAVLSLGGYIDCHNLLSINQLQTDFDRVVRPFLLLSAFFHGVVLLVNVNV